MDSEDEVVYEAGLDIKFVDEIGDDILDDKLCDSCETEKNLAEKYCSECEINLCYDCLLCHEKFKSTREHKVEVIEPKAEWFCSMHISERVDRYCLECAEACCVECSCSRHANHEFQTSETIINNIKRCKNYLKHLDQVKEDITENADDVYSQIDENAELLIEQIKDKSSKMKERVKISKNENIQKIVKHENKIMSVLNKLVNTKNDFIKQRQTTTNKELSNEKEGITLSDSGIGKSGYCNGTIPDSAAADEGTITSWEDIESYKHNCTIEARLNNIDLDFGLLYNSSLKVKLLRRISVPACRTMAIDKQSKRLFVVSSLVHSFDLVSFQESLQADIPLHGDIIDCVIVEKSILFSRSNKTYLSVYSFDSRIETWIKMDQFTGKMSFESFCKIICIDELQSAAKVYQVRRSESKTDSFSIYLLNDVKSNIIQESILNCVPFDEFDLLGYFHSSHDNTAQLKLIKCSSEALKYLIKGVRDAIYTIPNIVLNHNSEDVAMTRDKKNKVTVVSEGNKLLFFSDNFKTSKTEVQFVKVGDIDLADYLNEPSKILCDEHRSRLFVMSKTSQEILVFEYKVVCKGYE